VAGNYRVQQGDFLSKIAKAFGFSDYRTIWNDPNNAELKNERQNPNILYPGDVLYIPDRQLRTERRPTDNHHVFVKLAPKVKLRLILEDQYERPIANASCMLKLGAHSETVTTDGSGLLEQEIPPEVHDASLVIQDDQTPYENLLLTLKIGDLDPEKKISGQAARLNNLGYLYASDVNQPDSDEFESAVEEFQCDHGLGVDGICGPKTQAKLKEVHGC
jgi:hypothetical protein